MNRKFVLLTAVVAGLSVANAASAGFIATTGVDTVNNNDVFGGPGAHVGDSFSIPSGTFSIYVPSTTGPGANDPQLQGDLPSFGYTMDAAVTNSAGLNVDYAGNYRIFYDINGNNGYDVGTDTSVSFGTMTASASFQPTGLAANFIGNLTQTQGPTGPAAGNFADLGARYSGNPVVLNGAYVSNGGPVGTLFSTLTQTATAVPEPASLGLLALGGTALAARRRRR